MDYGGRSGYAIEIIPDASAVCSESGIPLLDQSIWATEDDYRAWNNGDHSEAVSNSTNDGRQHSHSRAGSEQPHGKKPRTSSQVDSAPSKSKTLGKMFFKTKLCCKFRSGTCPYVTNCNFAHGMEELRKPPPNWQEIVAAHEEGSLPEPREEHQIPSLNTSPGSVDGQRPYKGRHCKKFYTEEGCPYGDMCTFMHDEQLKARESVTISLSPTVGVAMIQKPSNWKTRICNKWELTGYCPFGSKCHFAHGAAAIMSQSQSPISVTGSTSTSATSRLISNDVNKDENAPLWAYVSLVHRREVGGGNRKWKCNFCEVEFGSYSMVKSHLLKLSGNDIRVCANVTQEYLKELQGVVAASEEKCKPAPKVLSIANASQTSQVIGEAKKKRWTIDMAFQNKARDELRSHIAKMFYSGGLPFHLSRNSYYINSYKFAANHNLDGFIPLDIMLLELQVCKNKNPLSPDCFNQLKLLGRKRVLA